MGHQAKSVGALLAMSSINTHTGYKHPRWTKKIHSCIHTPSGYKLCSTRAQLRARVLQSLYPTSGMDTWISFFWWIKGVFIPCGYVCNPTCGKHRDSANKKMYPFYVGIVNIMDTFFLPCMWCCVHTHTIFFSIMCLKYFYYN